MPADYYTAQTVVATGGTGNLFATNEVPIDMHSKTWQAFPALTPLTAILLRLSEQPAKQWRVDWLEENKVPDKVVVGTGLTSSGTALTVLGNGATLVKGTLLFNPRTWDIASVDSTPTSNSVTITRDAAGTTGVAWLANDVLYVLPPQVPENDDDTYRVASVADSNVYNQTQLIRMQFCIDRTANDVTTFHGGPGAKRAQLKAQKYHEFRRKWELLNYFGGRSSSGTAPATVRTMGGLTYYLRNGTLYKNFNSILTESGFRSFLGDYKDQNPDAMNVMLFAAGNVCDIISDFPRGSIRVSPRSKEFGIDIDRYRARGITVDIVPLPLLTDPTGQGFGFLLDLDRIMIKTLSRAMFFPEAKNVGESELIYDTYRVSTTLLVANESRHAMFVGAQV